jgi:hypothetical protein
MEGGVLSCGWITTGLETDKGPALAMALGFFAAGGKGKNLSVALMFARPFSSITTNNDETYFLRRQNPAESLLIA